MKKSESFQKERYPFFPIVNGERIDPRTPTPREYASGQHLYQAFLDATQGQATSTAASALLDRLDEK